MHLITDLTPCTAVAIMAATAGLAFASCAWCDEDLSAPPVTTARAWAIADGVTGELIAAHEPDEPQKAASTTKVMCAFVVLEMAKKDPAVLDELVKISALADATSGSTADLKAGEKISVREGLYGLLLPSGNDMGNAFAEHFHPRLKPPGKESPEAISAAAYKTRRNFIAEMNRAAVRLGMTKTAYRLSYGDGGTAEDRTTTARDLLTLGREAMKNDLFRLIVSTAEYTGSAIKPDGSRRPAKWENTNDLLKLDSAIYSGIKTGYTPSAGNCLLSFGRQDDKPLMIVVFGTPSDAARYADTRNLFRWAWGPRAAAAQGSGR